MQYKFNKHLSQLLPPKEGRYRILVAVSGGADSMCLLDLLYNCSVNVDLSIAHMNFNLRAEESNADEAFVSGWASQHSIPCYIKSVDTISYAKEHSLSVEMAARDLRYNWFFALKKEYCFDYIAVAHHSNDNAETLLLNLVRGAGIAGITGMKEIDKRRGVIRPLLSSSRQSIEKHLRNRGIPYRTDHTNLESDFARNRIRNEVMPQLKKINSSVVERLNRNMSHFSSVATIIERLLVEKRERLCCSRLDADAPIWRSMRSDAAKAFMQPIFEKYLVSYIVIEELLQEQEYDFWLFALLREYNFNPTQLEDLAQSIAGEIHSSDRIVILSPTHIAVKERGYIKVYLKGIMDSYESIVIEEFVECVNIDLPFGAKVILRISQEGFKPEEMRSGDGKAVMLMADADKIEFPLLLRSVVAGDKFKPFGMKGYKKVNDYLSDIKIDNLIKSLVPVLCSEKNSPDTIICMPGLQISNSYRVSESTSRYLLITVN